MTSILDRTSIRPARESDREAVFAFCATTWANGDYIPAVWDRWLADPKGVLMVAELEGTPVGLGRLAMLAPDEGWIEGIRVADRVRQAGIGAAIMEALTEQAREQDATVVRLFTDEDNTAARNLFVKLGFSLLAEVVRYEGEALDMRPDGLTQAKIAVPEDLPRLWSWLEQSSLTPMNGGLTFTGWTGQAMTEELLAAALTASEVTMLEEPQALAVAARSDRWEQSFLEVRYIDGLAEGIGRLGEVLRAMAHDQGLPHVELWLPDALILRDAMDGAGFARHDHMVVYVRAS